MDFSKKNDKKIFGYTFYEIHILECIYTQNQSIIYSNSKYLNAILYDEMNCCLHFFFIVKWRIHKWQNFEFKILKDSISASAF